ncbi:N-acetylmuramoyl-L-alanine amidase [Alteribacillus persepolensis]|uniref:N-acetylmuramoyl-L-alanine amidase n=1 Tax=Alteribacillus persepolensis TaxID=568899 RepID=A0A1G8FH71_9BACI|nr:cell wall hydrolase [Alteribacillus persepolensis]SDH81501.1 N-acetylmuramoyl-L-alanine amidase [Alteribacillus persepolensis]
MFKVIKTVAVGLFALISFQFSTDITKAYTVNKGDTLWSIGVEHGVSVLDLKEINKKNTMHVREGEYLHIPESITSSERDLLERLVSSEAEGESYAGKVAVATVVLNRVSSSEFPNTINEVIYDVSATGNPSFSPVMDGSIHEPADAQSKKAVKEALAFEGMGSGSLFFYNPAIATNHWISTRETTSVIGNHVFAK